MAVKGVFFDFWGTLCVMNDMDAELDEWISELYLQLCNCGAKTTRQSVHDYYYQKMWLENPRKCENGTSVFERRLEIAGAEFGLTLTPLQVAYMATVLLSIWDKYAVVDRVCVPLLANLKKQAKVTGLISNFDHPRHVHEIVRSTGMGKYFSAVIVSGDHDVKKPDRIIFEIALRGTGLAPENTLFIGDSEEDIAGANSAGMVSVLIDRKGQGWDYGQRHTIKALPEILQIV